MYSLLQNRDWFCSQLPLGTTRHPLCSECRLLSAISIISVALLMSVQVFDRCGLFTVDDDNRDIAVFLDRECLQDGQLFQSEFCVALKNSRVVVPIVSANALKRMCTCDVTTEDNVLVEVCRCHDSQSFVLLTLLCAVYGWYFAASVDIGN